MKVVYQHAVKESIVDLGFAIPSKAAQLAAHHIDNVKVVHPVPAQGCVNLDKACRNCGRVVSGVQVYAPTDALQAWLSYESPSPFGFLQCKPQLGRLADFAVHGTSSRGVMYGPLLAASK